MLVIMVNITLLLVPKQHSKILQLYLLEDSGCAVIKHMCILGIDT